MAKSLRTGGKSPEPRTPYPVPAPPQERAHACVRVDARVCACGGWDAGCVRWRVCACVGVRHKVRGADEGGGDCHLYGLVLSWQVQMPTGLS